MTTTGPKSKNEIYGPKSEADVYLEELNRQQKEYDALSKEEKKIFRERAERELKAEPKPAKLPGESDPMFTKALNLSYEDLKGLCIKDKNFADLCNNRLFWLQKIKYQYPGTGERVLKAYNLAKDVGVDKYKELFGFIDDYDRYLRVNNVELDKRLDELIKDVETRGKKVTFVDDIRKLAGIANPEIYPDFHIIDYIDNKEFPPGTGGTGGKDKSSDSNFDDYYDTFLDKINSYDLVNDSVIVTDPVHKAKENYYLDREKFYEGTYQRLYGQARSKQPLYKEYRLTFFNERFPLPIRFDQKFPLLRNSRNQPYFYTPYPVFNVVVSALFFPDGTVNIRVRSGPEFHRTKINLFPSAGASLYDFEQWIDTFAGLGYFPRFFPLEYAFVRREAPYLVIPKNPAFTDKQFDTLIKRWDKRLSGLYEANIYDFELLPELVIPTDTLYIISLGLSFQQIIYRCKNDKRFFKICQPGFWRDKIANDFTTTDGYKQFDTDYMNYVDSAPQEEYYMLYSFIYRMHNYFKASRSRFDQDRDRIERDISVFNNLQRNPTKPVATTIKFVSDIAQLDGADNTDVEAAIMKDKRVTSKKDSARQLARERLYEEYYQSQYGSYEGYVRGEIYFKQYVMKFSRQNVPITVEYVNNPEPVEPKRIYQMRTDLVVVVSMLLNPADKSVNIRVLVYPTTKPKSPLSSLQEFGIWLGVKKAIDERKVVTVTSPFASSFGKFSTWLATIVDFGYSYIIYPVQFDMLAIYPQFFDVPSSERLSDSELDQKSRKWDNVIAALY